MGFTDDEIGPTALEILNKSWRPSWDEPFMRAGDGVVLGGSKEDVAELQFPSDGLDPLSFGRGIR